MMQRLLAGTVSFGLACGPAFAQSADPSLSDSGAFAKDLMNPRETALSTAVDAKDRERAGIGGGVGSEYISGSYPGAVMVPVTILGAVPKNGVHYVPTRTNLLGLITYAGGPTKEAKLDEVRIKRVTGGDIRQGDVQEKVIKVDVEKLLEEASGRGPLLQQNDVVVIPDRKPLIDQNTTQVVGFLSGLLGIVVSAIVITNYNKSSK